MLRSTLATNASPVYGVAWSPESDAVLYTNGGQLIIKSLQANAKPQSVSSHSFITYKLLVFSWIEYFISEVKSKA